MYAVVFFDELRVKIRDEAKVRSKAVYLALAVLPDGVIREYRHQSATRGPVRDPRASAWIRASCPDQ
jgi:Transposase, Mutator family